MLDSIRKNKTGILMMLCSSVCVCFGQLCWKIAGGSLLWLAAGFLLYGLGALIMLFAYKHGSLSVLQPVLAGNYVLALILAVTLLDESVRWYNIAGVTLILAGVILIAGGDGE